jgi:hypothetical protein
MHQLFQEKIKALLVKVFCNRSHIASTYFQENSYGLEDLLRSQLLSAIGGNNSTNNSIEVKKAERVHVRKPLPIEINIETTTSSMPFLFYGGNRDNELEGQEVDTSPIYVDSNFGGDDDIAVLKEITRQNTVDDSYNDYPSSLNAPSLQQQYYYYDPTSENMPNYASSSNSLELQSYANEHDISNVHNQTNFLNNLVGLSDILKKVNCNI